MFEMLVERCNAHGTDALVNQITDGVIHHRRCDASVKPEAIRQISRHVKLAAAYVDFASGGFSKWDDTGIEPVDERAEGKEIKRAVLPDVKSVIHSD